MYVGQSVNARTHAQFLNEVVGTNYKQWMKCTYPLSDYSDIWMIRLTPESVRNAGWINTLTRDGTVLEERLIAAVYPSHKRGLFARTRVVFEIVETYSGREYVFRGIFKCAECTKGYHKWYRISDEFENVDVYK